MDSRKILEVCDADGKMKKAMHKNQVIWEPDRRITATVFYQEIEMSGAPAITKESVVKCLEKSKYRIAHVDGYDGSSASLYKIQQGRVFDTVPPNGICICGMTALALYVSTGFNAKKKNITPYHIFEKEIEQEIHPDLYAKYIQPAKDKVGEKIVGKIVDFYRLKRNEMGETP